MTAFLHDIYKKPTPLLLSDSFLSMLFHGRLYRPAICKIQSEQNDSNHSELNRNWGRGSGMCAVSSPQ